MKYLAGLIIVFFMPHLDAQNLLFCRMDPERSGVVNLKWYLSPLVSAEELWLYRKSEQEDQWKKVHDGAFRFGAYEPLPAELAADAELQRYLQLAKNPSNIKDLVLLAVLVKSFNSPPFSKYLGISYDDRDCKDGITYQYKLSSFISGKENDKAYASIRVGGYRPIEPPKEIVCTEGRKSFRFSCLPEPGRYYGINVYRKAGDTATRMKLTDRPLMLTEQKGLDSAAQGRFFFEDRNLKEKTRYIYYFEAIDFFGAPSALSDSIQVVLPDRTAPSPPGSLELKANGKHVHVKWKAGTMSDDLVGFHIYRTNNNDTDYTKVNATILESRDTTYDDVTAKFSSYLYKVSAVDQAGNENFCNPGFVEVFDNEPPSRPTGLKVKGDTGALLLRWNRNPENDLAGYFVYRTINRDIAETYVKLYGEPLKDTVFTDSLDQKTRNSFYYRIVAVDESLNRSDYSEAATARMPDVTAPSAPFLKTISLSPWKYPELEWLPNPEPDLFTYEVYRRMVRDSAGSFEKINLRDLSGSAQRFTDRYVEPGISYEYCLRAKDSALNVSLASNIIRFKVRKEVSRIEISDFNAAYNKRKRRVDLSWKTTGNTDVRGFIVYRRSGDQYKPISGMIKESLCYDNSVQEDSAYSYELRAYNFQGDVSRSFKALRIPAVKNRNKKLTEKR